MTSEADGQANIIRTERGLTIAGTRVTAGPLGSPADCHISDVRDL